MSTEAFSDQRTESAEPPASRRFRRKLAPLIVVTVAVAVAAFVVLKPEPRDCGLDKCGRTAQMELPPISDQVDFARFASQPIKIDFPVTNDRCAFLDEIESGGAPGTKALRFECQPATPGGETELGEVDVLARGLPDTFTRMYPPHQPECAPPDESYAVFWCSYSTGRLRIVARSTDLGMAQIRLGSVHKMLLEASDPY